MAAEWGSSVTLGEFDFRALAETMPTLIFVSDAAGRNLYANSRLCDFVGVTGEALRGDGWLDILHPDDRCRVKSCWDVSVAVAEPFETEYRLRAADGRYAWFLVRAVPVRDNGHVGRWVGTCCDIDDRKLAEGNLGAELQRQSLARIGSEARYRTVFQSMFSLVGLLATDGTLLQANDAALRFGGLPADAVIGRRIWELGCWAGDEAGASQLRAAVAEAAAGALVGHEAVVTRSDGESATISLTIQSVRDPAGNVFQLIAEGRDVTEARRTSAALAASRERLRRIVDSGIIGVGFGNEAGGVSEVNDAFLAMIGHTRAELEAGRINWRALTAPEYADRDAVAMAELRRDGSCRPYEKEYVLPDRRLPVQITMALCDPAEPDGEHIALVADLSVQKAALAALAEHRALLETRVAERTAQLARANARLRDEMLRREAVQAALFQSQKLEALGRLTSGIAHDFNNVTAAIGSAFSVISRRTDDPRVLDITRHGLNAAARATKLIQQLLAFARQQTLTPTPVVLADLLAELKPMLLHAVSAGIRLEIDVPEGLPPVLIDAPQLEAALINLAVNARDAMPGRGTLTVSVRQATGNEPGHPPELAGADAIAIRVADTGAGMPPDILHRVLEPFFTTKGPGAGTGLGLAMVHGLVEQSGGALRIESEVGVGTAITLYLRRWTGTVEAVEAAVPEPEPGIAPATILLIEDDAAVLGVLAAQLEDLGHTVIQAADAAAALGAMDAPALPDLVITDLALPDGDGIELARSLRGIAPDLPILFMTGQVNRDRLVGETVIEKPFPPHAFAREVAGMLDRNSPPGADDALLDRLAARLRSDGLKALFGRWRALKGKAALPIFDPTFLGEPAEDHRVLTLDVDTRRLPVTFAIVDDVAAASDEAREADLQLAVTGDDSLGSREAAYRRVATTGRPGYEFARFELGDGEPVLFERLLLPFSKDGVVVTKLVAAARYREGAARTGES